METYFIDIKIVSLSDHLTVKSPFHPSFRHLFLQLSATPERSWIRYFTRSRSVPRRQPWRKAWIERNHIVIDCIPEEMGDWILSELKQDVATANQDYRDFLNREIREEMKIRQAHDSDIDRVRSLKDRLSFDD